MRDARTQTEVVTKVRLLISRHYVVRSWGTCIIIAPSASAHTGNLRVPYSRSSTASIQVCDRSPVQLYLYVSISDRAELFKSWANDSFSSSDEPV